MTNKDLAFGAKPFSVIVSADYQIRVNEYCTCGTDATPLYLNDIVKTTGESNRDGRLIVTKADAGDSIRGIVVSIDKPNKADTAFLPYRAANTQRVIYVCDDPLIEFEMQVSGDFTSSDSSKNANILLNGGDNITGLSKTQIDSTTYTDSEAQIKILGLVEREENALGVNAKVKCLFKLHELAVISVDQTNGQQIYYVGKHGNDASSGRNWEEAFLTIERAIEVINLQTPSTTNRFAIVCKDSGIYTLTSSQTLPIFTCLDFRNATIVGQLLSSSGSTMHIKTSEANQTGGALTTTEIGSSDPATVNVENLIVPNNASAFIGIQPKAGLTFPVTYNVKNYSDSNNVVTSNGSINILTTTDDYVRLNIDNMNISTGTREGVVHSGGSRQYLSVHSITMDSPTNDAIALTGASQLDASIGYIEGNLKVSNTSILNANVWGTLYGKLIQADTARMDVNATNWRNIIDITAVAPANIILSPDRTLYKADSSSAISGTAVIPRDATIPQITEGVQIWTGSFTPQVMDRPVLFWFNGMFSVSEPNSSFRWVTVSLFINGGANAVATVAAYSGANGGGMMIPLTYNFTPTTAASVTFELRAGSDAASGTMHFNSQAGTQQWGGTETSSVIVTQSGSTN